MALPFLMPLLRSIYAVQLEKNSAEAFRVYHEDLVPARDFLLALTFGMCLIVTSWNILHYKTGIPLNRFEKWVSLIFIAALLFIVFIKTVVPGSRVI